VSGSYGMEGGGWPAFNGPSPCRTLPCREAGGAPRGTGCMEGRRRRQAAPDRRPHHDGPPASPLS